MVVFTCNHCGESLQKPKVEKHYLHTCRTRKSLTCVDCFKDFKDEEFSTHTKCVTEEERYAAKGSMPKGAVKKGELKQESWTEMIQSLTENAIKSNIPVGQRTVLEIISNSVNVPRKRIKFINFIKSSSGGRAQQNNIEAVWDMIETYKAQAANNKSTEQKDSENTTDDKKRKSEENHQDEVKEKSKRKKTKRNISDDGNLQINGNKEEPGNENDTKNGTDYSEKSKSKKVVENNGQNSEEIEDTKEPSDNGKPKKKKKKSKNSSTTEEIPSENPASNGDPISKKAKADKSSEDQQQTQENGVSGEKKRKSKHLIENGDVKEKKSKEDNAGKLNENQELEKDVKNISFSIEENILEIVKVKGSISLKKLEKKLSSVYCKQTGLEFTPKLAKKLNKKLKKLQQLEISEDTVKYSTC